MTQQRQMIMRCAVVSGRSGWTNVGPSQKVSVDLASQRRVKDLQAEVLCARLWCAVGGLCSLLYPRLRESVHGDQGQARRFLHG